MPHRRVLCGLLLASAVLACFAGWLWIASGPRVTRAKFEQVQKGMSREEVIRTVGGPPGDYSNRHCTNRRYFPLTATIPGRESWLSYEGHLVVWFDDTGTAEEVAVFNVDCDEETSTFTERILRWLGL
jgi:hypothetical protein